jgi:hypothetical protein
VTASAYDCWRQRYWRYPAHAQRASGWVIDQAQLGRDTYVGVHLFREWGNRRADNALPTVRALWLDEDDGRYPDDGPEPTAIIHSSAYRRHLYWRLTHPVAVEWVVSLNRRIAQWAGGDTGKAGLASVLRPSGTANFKRDKPDLVGGYLLDAPEWEPEVLDQAVPLLEEPNAQRAAHAPSFATGAPVDLQPYLNAVEVIGPAQDESAVKFAIICPWLSEHSGGDKSGTYLMQFPSGAPHFVCKHQHCEQRRWQEFKSKVRPVRWRPAHTDKPGYTGAKVRKVYREH